MVRQVRCRAFGRKSDKFIESFVESSVAAELAELDEQGDVILWGPSNGSTGPNPTVESVETERPQAAPTQPPGRPVESQTSAPTIRQTWPIDGGEIVFELRSADALPAAAFGTIGEVVAQLEALARSLSTTTPPETADKHET